MNRIALLIVGGCSPAFAQDNRPYDRMEKLTTPQLISCITGQPMMLGQGIDFDLVDHVVYPKPPISLDAVKAVVRKCEHKLYPVPQPPQNKSSR